MAKNRAGFFEKRILLGKGTRSEFYRAIELEMSAGGNLEGAIGTFASECDGVLGSARQRLFRRIKSNVENGEGLYEAVGDGFPADEKLFMQATEQVVDKADAYKKMADRLDEAGRTSFSVVVSLVPGMITMVAAFVLAYIVGGIIERQLATTVVETELASMAAFTLWFSKQSIPVIIAVALMPFMMIAAIFWTFPNWTGQTRRLVEGLGIFRSYRETIGASLLTNLAQMHNAGISFTDALEALSLDATPYLRRVIKVAQSSIAEGDGLGKALQRTGAAVPDKKILNHLSRIEKSTDFSRKLTNVVTRRTDQIQQQTQAKLQVYSYLAMFAGLGLVVLAFWPVLSLVDIGDIGRTSHLY